MESKFHLGNASRVSADVVRTEPLPGPHVVVNAIALIDREDKVVVHVHFYMRITASAGALQAHRQHDLRLDITS